MKSVKLFFLALLSTVILVSCNSSIPDSKIHNTKTEASGWAIEKTGDKPVMKYDVFYQISPTWGQSIVYAEKRSDRTLKVILSFICVAIFVGLFIGKVTNASWLPEKIDTNVMLFNALLFVSLIGAIYFWFGDASSVKWNNDKWVKKEVYDKAMETGSTQPIWDSLENNCLIVDGPYDCYKK